MKIKVLCFALLFFVLPLFAQSLSSADYAVTVWVNTKTSVYHCPGDRWYGKTEYGLYESQLRALRNGDRPAYGDYCRAE